MCLETQAEGATNSIMQNTVWLWIREILQLVEYSKIELNK